MNKPQPYFIEYQDPAKWTPERQEHQIEETLTDIDCATLAEARRRAKIIGLKYKTHVGIYQRIGIEQIDPPYGPWTYEGTEWVEDGK